MPSPAPFPSVLSTSGGQLVDANGFTVTPMKGFNVQAAGWSAQSFIDMYNKGARCLRTVVFWDSLEPTQGVISSSYIATLDTHIARAQAAGLYTTICFYYGPAAHCPSWLGQGSTMGHYTTNNAGQFATQYLAKRYGDPADPLGAGKYTKAVIGFGVNEPAPDNDSIANYLNATHLPEQKTMMGWFRTYAPSWIGIISMAWGGGCPLPNVSGSGQTSQTFTGAANDPFSGMGNWVVDLHTYFECTTDAATRTWDGRNAFGAPNGSNQIQPNQTTHPTYPPSGITRAQAQASQAAYFASNKAYCGPGHANVPLMIGEWGWVPKNGSTTFTGGDLYAADMASAFNAANAALVMEWDYNTSNTNDPWAARPGATAPGANPDGWQTATDVWMATSSGSTSDSASGSIQLSGSRVESHSWSKSASGTITLSGSATDSYKTAKAYNDAPLGIVALTGSMVDAYQKGGTFSDSPVGTIQLTWNSAESNPPSTVFANGPQGFLTLTGSAIEGHTITYTNKPVGTISLVGSGVETHASVTAYNDAALGAITLGGTSLDSRIKFHFEPLSVSLTPDTGDPVSVQLNVDVGGTLTLAPVTETTTDLLPDLSA